MLWVESLTQSPGRKQFYVGLIRVDGVHVHDMDHVFCQDPPQNDPDWSDQHVAKDRFLPAVLVGRLPHLAVERQEAHTEGGKVKHMRHVLGFSVEWNVFFYISTCSSAGWRNCYFFIEWCQSTEECTQILFYILHNWLHNLWNQIVANILVLMSLLSN